MTALAALDRNLEVPGIEQLLQLRVLEGLGSDLPRLKWAEAQLLAPRQRDRERLPRLVVDAGHGPTLLPRTLQEFMSTARILMGGGLGYHLQGEHRCGSGPLQRRADFEGQFAERRVAVDRHSGLPLRLGRARREDAMRWSLGWPVASFSRSARSSLAAK